MYRHLVAAFVVFILGFMIGWLTIWSRNQGEMGESDPKPVAPNVRCVMCGEEFCVPEQDIVFPRSLNVNCQCPACLARWDVFAARQAYLNP